MATSITARLRSVDTWNEVRTNKPFREGPRMALHACVANMKASLAKCGLPMGTVEASLGSRRENTMGDKATLESRKMVAFKK